MATLLSAFTQSPVPQADEIVSFFGDAVGRIQRIVGPLPGGFPPGPAGDVIVEFLRSPLSFLERVAQGYGGIVGLKLGGEHVVLVTDAALARQVLVDLADDFVKEGTAFFPGSSLAGNGLLVSDCATWRRQRQLSNPAFRSATIATYAQAMSRAAREMLGTTWAHSGARDVYADYNALTLRIATEALFGDALPPAQGAAVRGAIAEALEYFAGRAATGFVIPEWAPTPGNARYHEAVAQLDEAVYGIIDARRRELDAGGRAPQCLLDALLAARDEAGAGMGRRALRDELMTLLVAGQETSAILLGWASALLAHHPAAQARAAAEVAQVLGGAEPTWERVQQMPCLQAVVLEALRLQPPAYIVGRCAARPVRLGAYDLAAGTTVLVSPWVMHRDPQHWPRPQQFAPERWLPKLAGRPAMAELSNLGSSGAYLPFGAGPRNCIGTGFAMMETLIVLAHALTRVRFETLPAVGFPGADAKITLRPQSVQLMVERR